MQPGDWPCLSCGANVFASRTSCFRCGVPKGESGGDGGAALHLRGGSKKVKAAADSGFVDIQAVCKECSAPFTVTAGAQQFMKDKGFGVLVRTRCKACTSAKKERFGERYGAGGKGSAEDLSSTCYLCGERGHVSSACPSAPKTGGCFHCGKVGHISRNCPSASAGACFRCGQPGHLSKDCKQPPKGRA